METEKHIKEQLDVIEEEIEENEGHDKSHLIGFRNGLLWVLDDKEDESNVEPMQI